MVLLLVWVVRILLCVKGEVVLGDLAVAFAFGVGDEELRYMLARVPREEGDWVIGERTR